VTTIHFGVIDLPYVALFSPEEKRRLRWQHKRKPWQSLAATVSTADVAGWLEKRYHVFEVFWNMNRDFVMAELEDQVQTKIENVLLGKPGSNEPGEPLFKPGDLSTVEDRFRRALDNKEFDGWINGVPTQAALMGVSHRFKNPYARRPPRPSFIDTGLYRQSMKCWVE
jgi:hypothetical protein